MSTKRQTRRKHLRPEKLENRQLMAADITLVGAAGNIVVIEGSSADDVIDVREFTEVVQQGKTLVKRAALEVQLRNEKGDVLARQVLDAKAIDSVFIDAKAGNDIVYIDAKVNTVILGGEGNDTINGGSGSDVIFGGYGDDIIHGGDGQDALIGGPTDLQKQIAAKGQPHARLSDGKDSIDGGLDVDYIFNGDVNEVLARDKVDIVIDAVTIGHQIDTGLGNGANQTGTDVSEHNPADDLDADHGPIGDGTTDIKGSQTSNPTNPVGDVFSPESKFDDARGSLISDRAAGSDDSASLMEGALNTMALPGKQLGPIGVSVTGLNFVTDPSLVNTVDFIAAVASISGNPLLASFGTAYGITRIADETTGGSAALFEIIAENESPGEFGEGESGVTAEPITGPEQGEQEQSVDELLVDHGQPNPDALPSNAGGGGDSNSEQDSNQSDGDGDGGSNETSGSTTNSGTEGGGGDGEDEADSSEDDDSSTADDDESEDAGTSDDSGNEGDAEGEGGGGDADDSTPSHDDASGDNPNGGWSAPIDTRPVVGPFDVDPNVYTGTPADPDSGQPTPEQIAASVEGLATGLGPRTQWAINTGDQGGDVGGTQTPAPANLPDLAPIVDPGNPDGPSNPNE